MLRRNGFMWFMGWIVLVLIRYRGNCEPTGQPTREPSPAPTDAPTSVPTNEPTGPTAHPSRVPSNYPTMNPTNAPTYPTFSPSMSPTMNPSESPSVSPSNNPSAMPTMNPSDSPSNAPSNNPSSMPSVSPSEAPSDAPTKSPTVASLRVYNISFQFASEATGTFYIRIYGNYDEWTEWQKIEIGDSTKYEKNIEWNNVGKTVEILEIVSFNENECQFKCFKANSNQICLNNAISISTNSNQECYYSQISFIDDIVSHSGQTECEFDIISEMNTTNTRTTTVNPDSISVASTIDDTTTNNVANGITTYALPIAVGILLLLLIVNHARYKDKGRDNVNYKSIFSFLINIVDFWTDVATVFVYYDIISSNQVLFTVSVTFLLFAYVLSIFIGAMYFVQGQWKIKLNENEVHLNDRFNRWMSKYHAPLILMTILSGSFYNGIEFCSTKLFSYGLFFLPLKQSEFNKMLNIKVITMVLLANIPQLSMQFYYFTSVDGGLVTSKDNEIVLVSCIFTILSILIGSFPAMLRIQNFYHKRKYTIHETMVSLEPVLIIKSVKLSKIHCFGVKRIENAMKSGLKAMTLIDENDENSLKLKWNLTEIECYHVSDYLTARDEIHGYFEISIILNDSKQMNLVKSYLAAINDETSQNCQFLKKTLVRYLCLDKEDIDSIQLSMRNIDAHGNWTETSSNKIEMGNNKNEKRSPLATRQGTKEAIMSHVKSSSESTKEAENKTVTIAQANEPVFVATSSVGM